MAWKWLNTPSTVLNHPEPRPGRCSRRVKGLGLLCHETGSPPKKVRLKMMPWVVLHSELGWNYAWLGTSCTLTPAKQKPKYTFQIIFRENRDTRLVKECHLVASQSHYSTFEAKPIIKQYLLISKIFRHSEQRHGGHRQVHPHGDNRA